MEITESLARDQARPAFPRLLYSIYDCVGSVLRDCSGQWLRLPRILSAGGAVLILNDRQHRFTNDLRAPGPQAHLCHWLHVPEHDGFLPDFACV